MGAVEKTAFLSYRRTDAGWALLISGQLKDRGYDVFLDCGSLTSGDFEQSILTNIRARAHFLVVLTPTALDRCAEAGDWLRREIETALDANRNIVPLTLPGFDFNAAVIERQLTGKLILLKSYNALPIPREYLAAAVDRLCDDFLTISPSDVHHPQAPTQSCSFQVGHRKKVGNRLGCVGMALFGLPIVAQMPIAVAYPPAVDSKAWLSIIVLSMCAGVICCIAQMVQQSSDTYPVQVDDIGLLQSRKSLPWVRIEKVEEQFQDELVFTDSGVGTIRIPSKWNNTDKLVLEIRRHLKPTAYVMAERLMRRIEEEKIAAVSSASVRSQAGEIERQV